MEWLVQSLCIIFKIIYIFKCQLKHFEHFRLPPTDYKIVTIITCQVAGYVLSNTIGCEFQQSIEGDIIISILSMKNMGSEKLSHSSKQCCCYESPKVQQSECMPLMFCVLILPENVRFKC